MIDLYIYYAMLSLHDIFYEAISELEDINSEKAEELRKKYRMFENYYLIYRRMQEQGYETVNWEQGHKDGLYSRLNYQEIKELEKFNE